MFDRKILSCCFCFHTACQILEVALKMNKDESGEVFDGIQSFHWTVFFSESLSGNIDPYSALLLLLYLFVEHLALAEAHTRLVEKLQPSCVLTFQNDGTEISLINN
jgi:hypothetical protein